LRELGLAILTQWREVVQWVCSALQGTGCTGSAVTDSLAVLRGYVVAVSDEREVFAVEKPGTR